MKYISILLLSVIGFSACRSNQNENTTAQPITLTDVQPGPIRHDSLCAEQIKKITEIQQTFYEVLPISVEQTIIDFKRDDNPDKEIEVWQNMASAYSQYLAGLKKAPDLETKKEIFDLLLSRSMVTSEEALKNTKRSKLSDDEARKILSLYTAEPDPVTVVKNYDPQPAK